MRNAWPAAVFEDADTAERSPRYSDIAFGRTNELFVYRDVDAARAWDEHGAIPELANTMIHLLIGPSELTVVVDDPKTAEMRQILASIRDDLSMDVFRMVAKNMMPKMGQAA